ncbi:winged helix-turn-helix domain-containing protein [Acidithiobacillus sp.]|nr:winged helix-turn-helix domain-containing protein [Acidithiobacillus sp.]MCK9188965.1 winged helix-turn-helix domain-containing protein [Acidithiobacillus sp.]
MGWAKTYIAQASLVDPTERGIMHITDRGKAKGDIAQPNPTT